MNGLESDELVLFGGDAGDEEQAGISAIHHFGICVGLWMLASPSFNFMMRTDLCIQERYTCAVVGLTRAGSRL